MPTTPGKPKRINLQELALTEEDLVEVAGGGDNGGGNEDDDGPIVGSPGGGQPPTCGYPGCDWDS